MPQIGNHLLIETREGEPITVRDMTIVPRSQIYALRWRTIGWVLNRPAGVRIERGGQAKDIPINNITRISRGIIYVFGVVFLVLLWVQLGQRS